KLRVMQISILDPNGFEDEKEIKPSMGVKPGQTITIGF
ncbi:hypothetical protein LCGC14_1499510, partial [marine sediment metagenome]